MNDHKSKKKKMKAISQNLALTFTSLLLFILLLEVILRGIGYGNLVIYQPDPYLVWKPVPNQNCYTKVGHKPVYINAEGTRGKYFSKDKKNNSFRILSLGDSKTFGWGLEESETYSGLLEKLLQNHIGDSLKVEVTNAGVNAWSYAQMYVYLRDVGLSYSPDIIILADANLWTQFSEESSKEFINKMRRRVWLKNLLRRSAIYHFVIEVRLKKFYEKYRTKFIPVDPKNDDFFKEQQNADPAFFFKSQIVKITDLIRNHKAKGLLVYIPPEVSFSTSEEIDICKIKRGVAKEYNMPFIDLTEDFHNNTQPLFLPNDPVHPNAIGNIIIANRIFNFIKDEFNFGNTLSTFNTKSR